MGQKVRVLLVLLLFSGHQSVSAFSQELCEKVCTASNFLCWICSAVHGLENSEAPEDENELEVNFQPPDKADLIEKAKISSRQQKIVGGIPIQRGDLPYVVSIKYREGRNFYTFCGGALISEKFVITAAHCINYQRPDEIFIGVGDFDKDIQDPGEMLTAVVKLVMHPDYNSLTSVSDIGLIELAQRVTYDKYKMPVALPHVAFNLAKVQFNISGWGTLRERGESYRKLRRVEISYVPLNKCQAAYEKLGYIATKVQKGMLCAGRLEGGQDACQGDSGGPLVANLPGELHYVQTQVHEEVQMVADNPNKRPPTLPNLGNILPGRAKSNLGKNFWLRPNQRYFRKLPTLVGIVSWGLGCGRPEYAGVYTDVRVYRDWIINEISRR